MFEGLFLDSERYGATLFLPRTGDVNYFIDWRSGISSVSHPDLPANATRSF